MNPSRRRFLRRSTLSLAAVGAGALLLKSGVGPTEAADGTHGYTDHFTDEPAPTAPAVPEKFSLTEDNILGPFHRKGAPYRAKITPPLEPGKVLLISGRVWGHDTRKPLAGATIEIWQAN
ncbi:MAG TPA: twin-arginine translocation signal domain-containing protein, partial [Tepidisphaeraceae bacterium]